MASAQSINAGTFTPKHRKGRLRSRSNERLQSPEHLAQRAPEATVTELHATVNRPPHVKPTSRLELLLLAKTEKAVFIPEDETSTSHRVNQAIRACTEWSQVQKLVSMTPELTSSNLAFAVYRLGCLHAFGSKKRLAEMAMSNFIPQIFGQALTKVEHMEAGSLVLLLDGCARLQHQPNSIELSRISACVQQHVYSMYARQLSLVLWAFSTLHYNPGPQSLLSLEDAVSRQASELPPQSMALVLSSFHAAKHQLSSLTLASLADVIQRKMLLFKPSELATCLKALAAQGFEPTPSFLKAVMERKGEIASHSYAVDVPVSRLPDLAYMM